MKASMCKHNLRRKILSIVFIGMLSLPLVMRLAGVQPGEIENRALVEAPGLDLRELAEPNYVDDKWGPFLQDQLALRDWALHLRALLSLYLFEESSNPRVILGKDGFLFYEQELDRGCAVNWVGPDVIVDNVRHWADYFKSKGGEMLLVLVPDKAMVYREKLTDEQLERYACVDQRNHAVRRGLATIDSLILIDFYDELRAAAAHNVEPVYYRTDTHWKWDNGLMMVERIINELHLRLYDSSAVETLESKEQTDLALMLGLKKYVTMTDYAPSRPDIVTHEPPPPDGVSRLTRTEGRASELLPGSATIIVDSFFNRSIRVFESYFPEAVTVRPASVTMPAASASLRENRYFVIQAAMRNIYEMFSDGLTQQALEQVMQQEQVPEVGNEG